MFVCFYIFGTILALFWNCLHIPRTIFFETFPLDKTASHFEQSGKSVFLVRAKPHLARRLLARSLIVQMTWSLIRTIQDFVCSPLFLLITLSWYSWVVSKQCSKKYKKIFFFRKIWKIQIEFCILFTPYVNTLRMTKSQFRAISMWLFDSVLRKCVVSFMCFTKFGVFEMIYCCFLHDWL